MQASTRIGIALCLLVAGAVTAGLFRKTPEEAAAPADRSDGGLALRQPDQAPLLAAGAAADGWRNKAADAPAAVKGQRKPAGSGVAAGGPTAPPLPLLTVPEAAASVSASSDTGSSAAALSGRAVPLVGQAAASSARAAQTEADDDWQLHEVVDGDTLPSLAERYFGNAALAEAIRRANPALVKNTDILPIGAFLKIPSRRSLESAVGGTATAGRHPNAQPGGGWRKARDARP
jgi:phage tail protein X